MHKKAVWLSGRPIKNYIVNISPSSGGEMERSLKDYESSSGSGYYKDSTRLYLHIRVTSGLVTTTCVRRYFAGLNIDDILPFKDKSGALVKFFHSDDAYEGMRRYKRSRDVSVLWSSEKEWFKYGGSGHYDEWNHSLSSRYERREYYSRSPERQSYTSFRNYRSQPWHTRSSQKYSQSRHARSPPWSSQSQSPLSHSRSPRMLSRSPRVKSRSPRRGRSSRQTPSNEHDLIYNGDYHIHVTNLSYSTKKADLKKWFYNLVSDDQIVFLYDEKGNKKRECLVSFKNETDYKRVLRLDKVTFIGRLIFISSISKSSIRNLLTDSKELLSNHYTKGKCLYLRNFPSYVTKNEIQKFFSGFSLNEEDISLLCNRDGVGIGEVIVSLSSEEDLERAEKLHRKKFKGKQIPLRRIPEEKLQSLLSANSLSLMPENPFDCVTQEDDAVDEASDHEKNMSDKEDHVSEEDSSFHQMDNAHECVTQADDALEDSPVHVEDAPSIKCMSDENSMHVDNDHAIPEDETADDEDVTEWREVDNCTV